MRAFLIIPFLVVTNLASLAYIISHDTSVCRELVAIEKAKQEATAAAMERERKFWSNDDKPVPFPKFQDRGF